MPSGLDKTFDQDNKKLSIYFLLLEGTQHRLTCSPLPSYALGPGFYPGKILPGYGHALYVCTFDTLLLTLISRDALPYKGGTCPCHTACRTGVSWSLGGYPNGEVSRFVVEISDSVAR